MSVLQKSRPATGVKSFEVKATDDGAAFEGYAAVFGNVDSYGDVMVKGSFAETLATYGDGGAGVPCYWGHRMDDPMMNIGITTSAVEDDHGLKVRVELGTATAVEQQVRRLLVEGRVKQMSFAFDYVEGGWVDHEDGGFYEVRKVRLHEVSVVPVGANQETEILSAKAHDLVLRGRKDAAVLEAPPADVDQAETVEVPVEVYEQIIAALDVATTSLADLTAAVAAVVPAEDDDESPDPEEAGDEPDASSADDAAGGSSDPEPEPKSASLAERARARLRITAL